MKNRKGSRIDAALAIQAIKEGDNKIIEKIYADYRNDFIHWASHRFPFDQEDLRDVFQDVVIIFYDKVKTGGLQHLDCALGTFLYAIGFKRLCSLGRKKNKMEFEAPEELAVLSAKTMEDALIPEDIWSDERLILRTAINSLSKSCQKILIMSVYEELTNEEILQKGDYQSKEAVAVVKSKCIKNLTDIIRKFFT